MVTNLSEFLSEELAYWEALEKTESGDKAHEIHGAVCEVKLLIEQEEKINRTFLLERLDYLNGYAPECATYALLLLAKERIKKRMEAIIRIGKNIKRCS